MYSIRVDKRINQIMSIFYQVGLWHREEKATVKETRLKLFYSVYFLLFPISLMAGAVDSDDKDEAIFSFEIGIVATVLFLKLLFIIWRKKEIQELMNRICVYPVESHEEFLLINEKLKKFMKFVTILYFLMYLGAACAVLVVPFLSSDKTLFYKIGFPLDWKNNEVSYWIAFTFIVTEMILSAVVILFTVLIWYLMISCALRYKVLGHHIQNMGVREAVNKRKMSDFVKECLFRRDLVVAIESHSHIRELTNQMYSFHSTVFLVQIATSSVCICGSTYFLVFNPGENIIDYALYPIILLYNLFDIFMVMYFGNEIKLSSDRISYCLFESDWINRSQSTKILIIIFGELLMQPHELVILTLYPLTLETFTRILNGAYTMFNILKNIK